jgi:hypothetical protein
MRRELQSWAAGATLWVTLGPNPGGYANLSKRPSGPAKGIDTFSPSEMKVAVLQPFCAHMCTCIIKHSKGFERHGTRWGYTWVPLR